MVDFRDIWGANLDDIVVGTGQGAPYDHPFGTNVLSFDNRLPGVKAQNQYNAATGKPQIGGEWYTTAGDGVAPGTGGPVETIPVGATTPSAAEQECIANGGVWDPINQICRIRTGSDPIEPLLKPGDTGETVVDAYGNPQKVVKPGYEGLMPSGTYHHNGVDSNGNPFSNPVEVVESSNAPGLINVGEVTPYDHLNKVKLSDDIKRDKENATGLEDIILNHSPFGKLLDAAGFIGDIFGIDRTPYELSSTNQLGQSSSVSDGGQYVLQPDGTYKFVDTPGTKQPLQPAGVSESDFQQFVTGVADAFKDGVSSLPTSSGVPVSKAKATTTPAPAPAPATTTTTTTVDEGPSTLPNTPPPGTTGDSGPTTYPNTPPPGTSSGTTTVTYPNTPPPSVPQKTYYEEHGGGTTIDTDTDTCFTGESLVETPRGRVRIDKIKIGDVVLDQTGSINMVVDIDTPMLGERKQIGFNGEKPFTTHDHPFKVMDKGWVAVNPEANKRKDLELGRLEVGDVFTNGVLVESIDHVEADDNIKLYDLILDGSHEYIVNGYAVHNCNAGGMIYMNRGGMTPNMGLTQMLTRNLNMGGMVYMNKGGMLGDKISKIHGEGYTADGQAYAIAKSMGYNQGGMMPQDPNVGTHPFNREGPKFDTIRARLTPGEMVLDSDSTAAINQIAPGFLERVNRWEPKDGMEKLQNDIFNTLEDVTITKKNEDGNTMTVKSGKGARLRDMFGVM